MKDESPLSIGTHEPLMWRTNGRATSQVTIGFTGHRCGIRSGQGKKPRLCGQFGTKLLVLTSGGPALRRHQFPSNLFLPP